MSSHQLKHLQTKRNEAEALWINAKAKAKDAQLDIEKYRNQMKGIDDEINRLRINIVVSEHAFVRFFERVLGHDLEEIKEQILPPDVMALVQGLGDGSYPVGTTHRVKIKNNTVVTVLTKDEKD